MVIDCIRELLLSLGCNVDSALACFEMFALSSSGKSSVKPAAYMLMASSTLRISSSTCLVMRARSLAELDLLITLLLSLPRKPEDAAVQADLTLALFSSAKGAATGSLRVDDRALSLIAVGPLEGL